MAARLPYFTWNRRWRFVENTTLLLLGFMERGEVFVTAPFHFSSFQGKRRGNVFNYTNSRWDALAITDP
uniref:Uncharacterized protein n=1 Tax=Salix viminalis TaxID=40686 RepID=A0A6N2LV09_SALVM